MKQALSHASPPIYLFSAIPSFSKTMSSGCSESNPQIILQTRRVSQQQLYPIAYRSSLAHQNHENREYTHNKDLTKTKSTRPSHEVHQASKIKNPKERINIGKGGGDPASGGARPRAPGRGGGATAPPPPPPKFAIDNLSKDMSLYKQVLADRVIPPHGLPVTKESPEIDIRYSRYRHQARRFIPLARLKFRSCPPQRRIFSSLLVSDGGISHQPSLASATSDTRTYPSPLLTTYTKSLRFLFCGWRGDFVS